MPPIWVHFGFSLGGVAALGALSRRGMIPGRVASWLGLGLVIGAVGPDADLVASSLASALSGFDTSSGKFIHRTVTHGLPLVAVLLVAAAALWKRRPAAASLALGTGLGIGLLHVLPDLFYLVPVKLWAPLSFHEVGPYGPVVKERFTDAQNNVINGLDFLGDSLSYLAVWAWARRLGTASTFTRALPWLAAANAAIFVPLTIFVAPRTSYDAFLIWIYAPGLAFIIVSTVLIPWKARATFWRAAGAAPAAAPP